MGTSQNPHRVAKAFALGDMGIQHTQNKTTPVQIFLPNTAVLDLYCFQRYQNENQQSVFLALQLGAPPLTPQLEPCVLSTGCSRKLPLAEVCDWINPTLYWYAWILRVIYIQEERENVFEQAEKEISKMLAENLLGKFKATDEYKELAGELVFEAS